MDISLAMTSRGLLELGIDEHKENVSVKKRRLHDQARLTVYRLGVFSEDLDSGEVEIVEHG